MADPTARIAAKAKVANEPHKADEQFGAEVVQAYLQHAQDNAADSVRRVIYLLEIRCFIYAPDGGATIEGRFRWIARHALR